MRRIVLGLAAVASFTLCDVPARAGPPDGLGVLRMLGPHAIDALAPRTGTPKTISALVAIPSGKRASDYGLVEIAPGIARVYGSPASLIAFGAAHPDARVEVMPPLHPLLANARIITKVAVAQQDRSATGAGAAVGIIDTGIDPTLSDFRDPTTQKSRIAWMLDFSMKPLGLHAELEAKYGVKDDNGVLILGAVLTGDDIDSLISQAKPLPTDPNGHGTHVASIAAGNGGGTKYIGMAPEASLIIARVSRDATGSFNNGDIVAGATFVDDRATAMNVPVAMNLSLGSDFGPHDGNTLLEQALASFTGPQHPGRAVIAAAGNSGSVVFSPTHQAVEVTNTRVRVPVIAGGAPNNGTVQIWVALRAGSDIRVGLDSPSGTWISPIGDEQEAGHNETDLNAGVIYGTTVANTPVPPGSLGAIVLWSGKWPAGTVDHPYAVTLDGHGYADLYLTGFGDALGATGAAFEGGVREATVTLPGSNANIIAVGCTIDGPSWISAAGSSYFLQEPVLDSFGALPTFGADGSLALQKVLPGEVCFFSSAGPNLSGVPKPDILAPGAAVIGAMSGQAHPGVPTSIFTNPDCPSKLGNVDPNCQQVDANHAQTEGTSMSSPMVAGVVALLFQRDPTLTQDVIRAVLQAGVHQVRGGTPFFDQEGPGELDAIGALDALAELAQPDTALPDPTRSWMTLSESFAVSDGSTPVTATLELRTSTDKRATLFDSSRLVPVAMLGSIPVETSIVRGAAPGLFTFVVSVPPGSAPSELTLGATFDGVPIVQYATIPVAVDAWTADYPPFVEGGGCSAARTHTGDIATPLLLLGLLALRRRSR